MCRRSRTREIEEDAKLSWRSHPRKATVSSISSRSYRGEEASATSIIGVLAHRAEVTHGEPHVAQDRPHDSERLGQLGLAQAAIHLEVHHRLADRRLAGVEHPLHATLVVAERADHRMDGLGGFACTCASSSSFSESIRKGESVVFTSRTERRGVPVAPRG